MKTEKGIIDNTLTISPENDDSEILEFVSDREIREWLADLGQAASSDWTELANDVPDYECDEEDEFDDSQYFNYDEECSQIPLAETKSA